MYHKSDFFLKNLSCKQNPNTLSNNELMQIIQDRMKTVGNSYQLHSNPIPDSPFSSLFSHNPPSPIHIGLPNPRLANNSRLEIIMSFILLCKLILTKRQVCLIIHNIFHIPSQITNFVVALVMCFWILDIPQGTSYSSNNSFEPSQPPNWARLPIVNPFGIQEPPLGPRTPEHWN